MTATTDSTVTFLPEPIPEKELGHLVISTDDHLIEPRDMFGGRMPAKLADRGPRIIDALRGNYGSYRLRKTSPKMTVPRETKYHRSPDQRYAMCPHRPSCPPADHSDRDAAQTVAFHPEQGWSLLCNGVIVFDDMGEILPGGRMVPPHAQAHVRLPTAA